MVGQVKRGTINFIADGADMTARLSTNAMAAYQDKTGEQFVVGLDMLSKSPGDIVRLRNLFWAAIVGDYSMEEVGDLIDDIGMGEVVEIIGQAVQAAFPASVVDMGKGKGAKTKAPATT
mgnify:CR=1 FL=1